MAYDLGQVLSQRITVTYKVLDGFVNRIKGPRAHRRIDLWGQRYGYVENIRAPMPGLEAPAVPIRQSSVLLTQASQVVSVSNAALIAQYGDLYGGGLRAPDPNEQYNGGC